MLYPFYTIMRRLSRLLLEGLLKFPVHRCPKFGNAQTFLYHGCGMQTPVYCPIGMTNRGVAALAILLRSQHLF